MIDILALRQAYDGRVVLDIREWRVSAGEHWLVLGKSGSGKSTLIHLVAGLTRPSEGRIRVADLDLGQAPAHCRSVLESLELGNRLRARPRSLSQGERQRVALARAVVNRPKLILADEPTSSLDDESCQRVVELLETQARVHEATLVVATHDRRLVQRFDRRLELGS